MNKWPQVKCALQREDWVLLRFHGVGLEAMYSYEHHRVVVVQLWGNSQQCCSLSTVNSWLLTVLLSVQSTVLVLQYYWLSRCTVVQLWVAPRKAFLGLQTHTPAKRAMQNISWAQMTLNADDAGKQLLFNIPSECKELQEDIPEALFDGFDWKPASWKIVGSTV